MRGYVLADLSVGGEKDFFDRLGSVPQVRHVYYLFDEYEYLVEIEADSVEDLARVATNHIRHLPGVERTASFIEGNTDRWPRIKRGSVQTTDPSRTLWG
ncbi:MAG TPA: Lrp/AsnC ligand binding domain-containing protein [Thermoplasmata archaeon]